MINKEEVKKQGMTEQVKKEISLMPLVKHPNIIELKEVMATKTKIYLVMEYVGGGDLYTKVIKDGKLDEEVARKFFQQLITAVEYCHSRGVCHRDLKLENILLDPNGENLKLCDFGLATFLGDKDKGNYDVLLYTACGAFAYMAPEIIRGEMYDGRKADIWSCGVILYTLLAGYPPFQDENRMQMLWKIRVAKYELPLGLSNEVEDLIKKILVTKPRERIMMSDIMKSPWFKIGLSGSYDQCDSSSLFCPSPEASFNAFDFMLSMASGLDLSGLFENQKRKLGSLFVTKCSTKEVMKKLEKMAVGLKYEARKEKVSRMVLKGEVGRRGRLVMVAEVFEVSTEVKVVEFSKRAGDSVEYLKLLEEEVRLAMKDLVWKWQGEWIHGRNKGGKGSVSRWKLC